MDARPTRDVESQKHRALRYDDLSLFILSSMQNSVAILLIAIERFDRKPLDFQGLNQQVDMRRTLAYNDDAVAFLGVLFDQL